MQPVSKRKKVINIAEIEAVVAKIARIPEKSVSTSDREILKNLGAQSEDGGVWARESH